MFSTSSITLTTCQNGYTDTTIDLCPATHAPPHTQALDQCKLPMAYNFLCTYHNGTGYDLPRDLCKCADGRMFSTSQFVQKRCNTDRTVTERTTHPCGYTTTPATNYAITTSTATTWGKGAIMPALASASNKPFCLSSDYNDDAHPGWSAVDMDNAVEFACDKMKQFKAKLGKTAHRNAYGLYHVGKTDSIPKNKVAVALLMKNAPDSCYPGFEIFDFVSGREECQDILYDVLGRGCNVSSKKEGGRDYWYYYGGAIYHNCVYYEIAPYSKFQNASIQDGWRPTG